MPELPEVETIKRDLEQKIIGLMIEKVWIFDDRVIKNLGTEEFVEKIVGCRIQDVLRRSKAIILSLSNKAYLVIQPKMTGHLIYGDKLRKTPSHKETKVAFRLSNGRYLNYQDLRLFGWLIYTDDLDKLKYIRTAGPEPLSDDFSIEWLRENLKKRKVAIKTLLMNQKFLAGIGNIYASEILFAAGIIPKKSSKKLTLKEIQSLHWSTKEVLNEAIRWRGTSIRNYRDIQGKKGQFINRIKVYGRENQACYVCRKPIQRIVQSGRSTFFCKKCQS